MGASQSNLSATGFDYVVAITQESINATLEEYLFQGLPEAILCYVYDANNNPTPVEYADLVAKAGGTDPFSVPNGTASSDPRVQSLNDAYFAFAIKAKLGLPPGIQPSKLPPIVALKPGQSSVTYTLMFSEFIATELIFGPRNSVVWFNESQPTGASWTFSGPVDLDFQSVAFTDLPPEIQARLKDPGEFQVQQLYYDLNSSYLEQGFQFANVPSNSVLNGFMAEDFVNTYWKSLKGQSVLGYGATSPVSIVRPGSLTVTDMNFFTPQAAGSVGAQLALNYLCATNGDSLPGTTHAGFGWNWIDPAQASQYAGVAALNRDTLARYLNDAIPASENRTLADYVASNCYLPSVRVTYKGGIELEVEYEWSMEPGQRPLATYPPTGSTILSYSYGSHASDRAGAGGAWGQMELTPSFNLTVSVAGTKIEIVQHLVIYLYVRYLQTRAGGNVVDKQITNTYNIGVGDDGSLVAIAAPPQVIDNSQRPKANDFLDFWADVDSMSSQVTEWIRNCTAMALTNVPVSFVQNFVFPGGSAFTFADASFSEDQDLVSHVRYAAVSQ